MGIDAIVGMAWVKEVMKAQKEVTLQTQHKVELGQFALVAFQFHWWSEHGLRTFVWYLQTLEFFQIPT